MIFCILLAACSQSWQTVLQLASFWQLAKDNINTTYQRSPTPAISFYSCSPVINFENIMLGNQQVLKHFCEVLICLSQHFESVIPL